MDAVLLLDTSLILKSRPIKRLIHHVFRYDDTFLVCHSKPKTSLGSKFTSLDMLDTLNHDGQNGGSLF